MFDWYIPTNSYCWGIYAATALLEIFAFEGFCFLRACIPAGSRQSWPQLFVGYQEVHSTKG